MLFKFTLFSENNALSSCPPDAQKIKNEKILKITVNTGQETISLYAYKKPRI